MDDKKILTCSQEFIVTVDNKEILERANHFMKRGNKKIKELNF